jgi:hypothetical protein
MPQRGSLAVPNLEPSSHFLNFLRLRCDDIFGELFHLRAVGFCTNILSLQPFYGDFKCYNLSVLRNLTGELI